MDVGTPPPAAVEVAPLKQALVVGGSTVLTATARSANGDPRTDVKIQWSSKAPAIVKVDESGMVKAVAPGKATVVATGGPVSGEVSVQVVADNDAANFAGTCNDHREEQATWCISPRRQWTRKARRRRRNCLHQLERDRAARDDLSGWSVRRGCARQLQSGCGDWRDPNGDRFHHSCAAQRAALVGGGGAHPDEKSRWVGDADDRRVDHRQHFYVSTMADRIMRYDISDPSKPKALDSLKADARLINDISTTPDGKVGVFTREGASTRKNGIVFFDPSDPAHLKVLSEYTETVTGGVHSAFINAHYVYITDDATGSLRMIDFLDAQHPKEVARWEMQNPTATMIAGRMGGMIEPGAIFTICM